MTAPMPETMSPREKVFREVLDAVFSGFEHGQCEKEWETPYGKEIASLATDAILAALASGSVDHAELARLAEAATPGPWKGRQPAYSEGTSYIESELPCINGLSAWFSVAIVPAPSPEELGYSDGAIDSDANAAFIAAANPATVLALLAEIAALRGDLTKTERDYSELRDSYDRVSNKLCVERAHGGRETKRATEAERKLAEAVAVIRDVDQAARQAASMNDAGYTVTVERTATHIYGITDAFLSKEAERG